MISPSGGRNWYELEDPAAIFSPALLVYRRRVEENLAHMLAIAGGPEHLRPHLKTHKMPDLLRLQLGLGISKFKCATIAEAEMATQAGVSDLLLAYQPVGPAINRVFELFRQFPQIRLSVIADDPETVRELSRASRKTVGGNDTGDSTPRLEVMVDLDIGQHRTGIAPGPGAVELYRLIAALPGLKPGGLHAYDGHLTLPDPTQRATSCEQAFGPVTALRDRLALAGLDVPRVVAGGTPTFPFHARRNTVECSPGTCVFWDAGYANKLKDLDFLPSALLLTRVVSKPTDRHLCLDLGHKAVAAEMPHPRVVFMGVEDAQSVAHSEEHLVIETRRSAEFKVGDCLYGLPWHICPTVALHAEAKVIDQGKVTGVWKVTARERRLTI